MTNEEKRKLFVAEVVALYADGFSFGDVLETLKKSMVYIGQYDDLTSADKKKEVLSILEEVLAHVDTFGPDAISEWFIMQGASYAVDWIYENFKDKLSFGEQK